jgi:hypothetical protein
VSVDENQISMMQSSAVVSRVFLAARFLSVTGPLAVGLMMMVISSGCAKQGREPAFPGAGLTVHDDKGMVAMCGFYAGSPRFAGTGSGAGSGGDATVKGEGLNLELTPLGMTLAQAGHKLQVSWKADYGREKDIYDFTITVDGATSQRKVEYVGQTLTLMETPFRVVVGELKAVK